MLTDARPLVFSAIAFLCVVLVTVSTPAEAQGLQHLSNAAADSEAQAQLSRILAGLFSDTSSHMRMGPSRSATPADSARAARFVAAARAALGQYADVRVAQRDGYAQAMAWLDEQPIFHFSSSTNAIAAGRGEFDVSKPVSLLYKKDGRGRLRLVGAMYAAAESAEPKDLDALLPTSMAQWHEHVKLCTPDGSNIHYRPQVIDAGLVFWLRLYFSITSQKDCDEALGRFEPESGWMAHVYMFAGSDDPSVIWGTDDAGDMAMPMQQPHTRSAPPAR